MKYRSEIFYGSGCRDAAEIMAYETFKLGNTDILETLSTTILKNTEIGDVLEIIQKEMYYNFIHELDEDGYYLNLIIEAYTDKEIGINFFKEVLEEVNKITGKDIKYCLWLCDTKEDVYDYDLDGRLTDKDIDIYEESDIILSDLGPEGKLYGYENMPIKV